jgi:hypothetical protein
MLMSWVPSIHGVTDLTILVSAKAAALQWPTVAVLRGHCALCSSLFIIQVQEHPAQ